MVRGGGRPYGIDWDSGLDRMMGNEELYRDLLAIFIRDHASAVARAAAGLRAGARDEARIAVHSVRGAAGNIGARDLQRAAAAVEGAILAGGDPSRSGELAVLAEELSRVVAALVEGGFSFEARLPEEGPRRAAREPEALAEALDRLAAELEAGSFEAGALAEELRDDLSGPAELSLHARLLSETGRFDAEAALLTLRALRSELEARGI